MSILGEESVSFATKPRALTTIAATEIAVRIFFRVGVTARTRLSLASFFIRSALQRLRSQESSTAFAE